MRVMIELSGPDLQKSIDNGSLMAFIANATAVRWGEGDQHLPPKVDAVNSQAQQADPTPQPQAAAQDEPTEETPKQEAPPKPGKSLVDLRTLLGGKIQAGHRDAVSQIIQAHGGTNLNDLPETAYDAVYQEAEKL